MAIETWQKTTFDIWLKRLREDRLPHAILLSGRRGLGKRDLAKAFVDAICCLDRRPDASACGACRNCLLNKAGTHPDVHLLEIAEGKSGILVDQARDLIGKAVLTSSLGKHQAFIIDPADRLNVNAANALLKTIEEPRSDTVMLLLAQDPSRLPITIRSRCQRFHLEVPSHAEGRAWLASQLDVDADVLNEALIAAGGVPRLAAQMIKSGSLDAFKETQSDIRALRDRGDPLAVAGRWVESDPSQRLLWMSAELSRWARMSAGKGLTEHGELASLTGFVADVDRTRALLDTSLRPELLVEALLNRWQRGAPDQGVKIW